MREREGVASEREVPVLGIATVFIQKQHGTYSPSDHCPSAGFPEPKTSNEGDDEVAALAADGDPAGEKPKMSVFGCTLPPAKP